LIFVEAEQIISLSFFRALCLSFEEWMTQST